MVVIYLREEQYTNADKNITSKAILFNSKEESHDWLKSQHYTKIKSYSQHTDQCDVWMKKKEYSEIKAIVIDNVILNY